MPRGLCCKFTQLNWSNDVFQTGSFETGKFTMGPKAEVWLMQSGYYLHISEIEGNLKVNKSSSVEIVDLFCLWPNPLSKFLKISHHSPGLSVSNACRVRCAVEIKSTRSCLALSSK